MEDEEEINIGNISEELIKLDKKINDTNNIINGFCTELKIDSIIQQEVKKDK